MRIIINCRLLELNIHGNSATGILEEESSKNEHREMHYGFGCLVITPANFPFQINNHNVLDTIRKGSGHYKVTCGITGNFEETYENNKMWLEILEAEDLE